MSEPKRKWWKVSEQDVGRELADPDWVEWAVKRIAELEKMADDRLKQRWDECDEYRKRIAELEAKENARMDAARAYLEQADKDQQLRVKLSDRYP
jgi:hypothetical protein